MEGRKDDEGRKEVRDEGRTIKEERTMKGGREEGRKEGRKGNVRIERSLRHSMRVWCSPLSRLLILTCVSPKKASSCRELFQYKRFCQ
jgi:hypothetical protein